MSLSDIESLSGLDFHLESIPLATSTPAPSHRTKFKGCGQLFKAVENGNFWKVKFLIQKGIPINVRRQTVTNEPTTVLATSLAIPDPKTRLRMFKLLIKLGADVLKVDEATERDALLWAAFLNRTQEVKVVLDCESSVDMDFTRSDRQGFTALHYAVFHNNPEILKFLVSTLKKYDLSVDITDPHGFTPYLHAVRKNYDACAEILLSLGGAYRGKRDKVSFMSEESWRKVGGQEKIKKEKKMRLQEAAVYKSTGRLPQLRAAGFDPRCIQIARQTKVENAWVKNLKRENTMGRIQQNFNLPTSLYGGSSEINTESRRRRLLGGPANRQSTQSLPEIPTLSKSSDVSSPASFLNRSYIPPLIPSQPTTPHEIPTGNNTYLTPLMDLYSVHQTSGYREAAPKCRNWTASTFPEGHSVALGATVRLSRFAVVMRKNKKQKGAKKGILKSVDENSVEGSVKGRGRRVGGFSQHSGTSSPPSEKDPDH